MQEIVSQTCKYDSEKYLVVDLETTKPTIFGKIVQIGIAQCNWKENTSKIVFSQFINEDIVDADEKTWIFGKESPVSTNKHPLNFEEVKQKGVSIESVRNTLQILFDTYPVCAYNIYFDINYLLLRGFRIPYLLPCPMVNMSNVMKIPYDKRKYKYPKCEESYHYLYPNDNYIENHHADDDAKHEGFIFNAMIQSYLIEPYRFDYIDIWLETELEDFERIWLNKQLPNTYKTKIEWIISELIKLLWRITIKIGEVTRNHPLTIQQQDQLFKLLWYHLSIRYNMKQKELINMITEKYIQRKILYPTNLEFQGHLQQIIESEFYIGITKKL